jgi:hypothetical protein
MRSLLPWVTMALVNAATMILLGWLVLPFVARISRASCRKKWGDQENVPGPGNPKLRHEKKMLAISGLSLLALAGLCLPFRDYLPGGGGAAGVSLVFCGLGLLIAALLHRPE